MSSQVDIKGNADTRHGTESILNGANFAAVMVKTAKFTPIGDYIEEANNAGFTGTSLSFDNGWDCELSCVDDPALDEIVKGGWISVTNPREGAARDCDVEKVSCDYDRKQTGTCNITCHYRPDRPMVGGGGGNP